MAHIPLVHASVVINEILPKIEDAKGSWIELYNNGSEPVSLDRWKIENTVGEVKTYTLNASAIIQSHGFLIFYNNDTGIPLNKSGDVVKLTDEKNTILDSQTYPGILGYNIAVGRTTDGGGIWVVCAFPTGGKTNNCLAPTETPTLPTPIPIPTAIPEPTFAIPAASSTPEVISTPVTIVTTQAIAPKVSPLASVAGTTTSVPDTDSNKRIGLVAMVISITWIALLIGIFFHKRRIKTQQ